MWEEIYNKIQQDLTGMWDAVSNTTMQGMQDAADWVDEKAPHAYGRSQEIEEARTGGDPVVLDVFKDTTDSDTTDSLGTEMDLELFKSQLVEDEGHKSKAYEDTEGHLTIGVGHKVLDTDGLTAGSEVTEDTIDRMLNDDASQAVHNAMSLVDDWEGLPSNAKYALSNMTFQLGKTGVSKFSKTLALINKGDFKGAAVEMLDSKWAKQTPSRAKKMSGLMATASR